MKIFIDQRRIYQYSTEDQKSMTGRSKIEVTDGKLMEENVSTEIAALEEKRVCAAAKRDFRQKIKILFERATKQNIFFRLPLLSSLFFSGYHFLDHFSSLFCFKGKEA